MPTSRRLAPLCVPLAFLALMGRCWAPAQEPPALNPFGAAGERADQRRDNAVPGFLELSDGTVRPGQVFLTRDARLKVYDEAQKKHREIPLRAITRVDCRVLKEWDEKEWRFRANASDEKYFTGRTYPVREYAHAITLQNGQAIRGTLSGIVYVQAPNAEAPERFLLHNRDKGQPGTDLKGLVYVRSIRLGPKALEDGLRRAARPRNDDPARPPRKTRNTRKEKPGDTTTKDTNHTKGETNTDQEGP